MKATVRDVEALRSIRPVDLTSYLATRGWIEEQRLENGAFWTKRAPEGLLETLVPLNSMVGDFATRVSEVLAVLAAVEDRSQLDILDDLSIQNADVIRPRLLGTGGDGTITLEQGKVLHEKARDMMLAAACAALEPRSLFAQRKPELAMAYVNRARFGLARRGSYIMTIISPVLPGRPGEEDLVGGQILAAEPFERKAMRMLASGLSAVAVAAPEAAATGNYRGMLESAEQGVSAQLCESIVGLHEGSGRQGVEFSFAWSLSRPAPERAIQNVTIQPDVVPAIAETARLIRNAEPQEDIEVIGTVQRLQHEGGQQGDVTVFGVADVTGRTVHILLGGAEHDIAVEAYHHRRPVSCRGRLVKEGRSWRLLQPRGFHLLEELF